MNPHENQLKTTATNVFKHSYPLSCISYIFAQVLFWAENQGNHQNFAPSLLSTQETLIDFHEITKKCIFTPFLSLRQTAWWPYRLSHINALCINLSYSPQGPIPKIFGKRYWELEELKISGFWVGHFSKNITFFSSSPWKSVKVSWVARMGPNFNDYPGFQPKTTPAQRYATQCM